MTFISKNFFAVVTVRIGILTTSPNTAVMATSQSLAFHLFEWQEEDLVEPLSIAANQNRRLLSSC
jgi:hypothetical protein